jgi:hypothetical protein
MGTHAKSQDFAQMGRTTLAVFCMQLQGVQQTQKVSVEY